MIPWLRPAPVKDPRVEIRFHSPTRGQNGFEVQTVALAFNLMWMLLICSVFWHLVDLPWFAWLAAFALSSFPAFILILGTTFAVEPLVRLIARFVAIEDRSRLHGAILHLVLAAMCLAASFDSHWIRWPAIVWLALLVAELVASSIEPFLVRREEKSSES